MKRDVWLFLFTLVLALGLGSCNDDGIDSENGSGNTGETNGTTYIGLTITIPSGTLTRASDDQDYNYQGSYSGYIGVDHLDLYLYSADGKTQLMAKRFSTLGTDFTLEIKNGQESVQIATPFETNPGEVLGVVVINCYNPLVGVSGGGTDVFKQVIYKNISRSGNYDNLTGDGYSGNTQVSTGISITSVSDVDPTDNETDVYKETIIMSGQSTTPFIIQDNVSREDVIVGHMNVLTMDVTKIVSKAIVTYGENVKMGLEEPLGTISNVTYSIAQGGNSGYLFKRSTADGYPMSWGFDFVPGPTSDYASNAAAYYEYDDLKNTSRAVTAIPNASNPAALRGVYLMPNTHQYGADFTSSGYKKGNTAYALIRAKFTPDPSKIYDEATLAEDGTFYYGYMDHIVYATLEDAQIAAGSDYDTQPVQTFVGGKMMYYVWLNPDNANDPEKWTNSPVVRNNIYHVEIKSFKKLGTNWNPLVPSNITNPDPKPAGPEPPSPISPTDPIGNTNTYMSVDIQAKPWKVHSYDKVL